MGDRRPQSKKRWESEGAPGSLCAAWGLGSVASRPSLKSLSWKVLSVQNFVGAHQPSMWPVVSLNSLYHHYIPPFGLAGMAKGGGVREI